MPAADSGEARLSVSARMLRCCSDPPDSTRARVASELLRGPTVIGVCPLRGQSHAYAWARDEADELTVHLDQQMQREDILLLVRRTESVAEVVHVLRGLAALLERGGVDQLNDCAGLALPRRSRQSRGRK